MVQKRKEIKMDTKNLGTALGPLAPLYFGPDVLEIMVDSCDRTLVEKERKLIDAEVKFDSPEAIQAVVEALLALTGKQLNPEETVVHIPFPESQARAVAIFPPTAIQGPHLVIRKLMNTSWISWENLLEWNSISQEAYEFLQKTMRSQVNVLVVGGTGSGKTTLANRIAELIPAENRLVIVENFHELQIQHPRTVYLEAVTAPNVSISDLIRTGSIMRPDWLIIGELTGPEAMTAMEIMSRGHTGLTTLHANSPEDALARLEGMCLMANLGLGLEEIRVLIAAAVQLITFQRHMPDGSRKMLEIVELRGVENGRFVLERLFRFDPQVEKLASTGVIPGWE
jgi:pilus assembly protein CpaF